MQKNYMQLVGKLVHYSGYNILPIMPGTKKPGMWRPEGWTNMTDWTRFCSDRPADGTVDIWSSWPGCGIGVACGNVVAIDIDILDEDVADNVEVIIRQQLGITSLKRVGKAPKMLLVYRTDEPFKKIKAGPIEALCDGQQFVAYSIHPDTDAEYSWPESNLFDVPLATLTKVTHAQVARALQLAYDFLPEELQLGPRAVDLERRSVSAPGASSSHRGLTANPEAVISAVEHLSNPDLHWEDWNRIGMAIWAASQGADWGREIWFGFSDGSDKSNPKETAERWSHYFVSPPSDIGAGTLFKLAGDEGWTCPANIDFHSSDAFWDEVEDVPNGMLNRAPLTVIEGGLEAEPEPTPEPEAPEMLPAEGFRNPDGTFPKKAWMDESHGLVARVANWIYKSAQYPQPELALANTLAMFGAIFGRNYRMQRLKTRTNLLIVGVAPTGGGKDHSRSCIKMLLKEANMMKIVGSDNIASGAAVESMLKDYPVKLTMLDEMGMFMSGIINPKAGNYEKDIGKKMLQFYSASSNVYTGTAYADTKAKPPVEIHNPIWCVYGTTTPATLRPAFQQALMDDGTLPRLLFFVADRVPQDFEADPSTPPPEGVVDYLASVSGALPAMLGDFGAVNDASTQASYIEVQWTPESYEMYKAMSLWCAATRDKRGDVWTRVMENTIKVAMIDSICSTDLYKPILKCESLQKAFDLSVWCMINLETLIRVEGAENESEAQVKRVMRLIKDAGKKGLTATELNKSTKYLSLKLRGEIITTLTNSGEIREEKIKGKTGRPTIRYYAA